VTSEGKEEGEEFLSPLNEPGYPDCRDTVLKVSIVERWPRRSIKLIDVVCICSDASMTEWMNESINPCGRHHAPLVWSKSVLLEVRLREAGT
jgi:hypothetical protein